MCLHSDVQQIHGHDQLQEFSTAQHCSGGMGVELRCSPHVSEDRKHAKIVVLFGFDLSDEEMGEWDDCYTNIGYILYSL